jgi:hypothetical protein
MQQFLSADLDKKVTPAPGAIDLDPGHRVSGVDHHTARQLEQ